MLHSVWAIGSLLLSVALLLFGHGMHLTLLPLMAEARAWTAGANALTTSAYFLGFGAGCLIVPRWLLAIGHIRVFVVLVALATGTLLALTLLEAINAWLVLRFVYGIAISGIYLTVESWLNAETQPRFRGAVLAIYAFVTLIAMFGAQMLLQAVSMESWRLLVLAALFLSIAALPIGVTRRQAPRIVASPHFRLRTLLNAANLPAMAAGALAGTFWALAPVFTARLGYDAQETARFMAAALGGGMLSVYPLGWLSDRCGRATILGGMGFIGVVGSLAFLLFADRGEAAVMLYGVGFGALTMPLYALCVALANDNAAGGDFVETGSIVIMANALGMVSGPMLAGWLLTGRSPEVLLWFWAGAFAALGIFAALLKSAHPEIESDMTAFELVPRTVPEALVIDPRADHSADDDAANADEHATEQPHGTGSDDGLGAAAPPPDAEVIDSGAAAPMSEKESAAAHRAAIDDPTAPAVPRSGERTP